MIEVDRYGIGRRVVYRDRNLREKGRITSYNDDYVFVIYDGDRHAKATRREDLEELMSELSLHDVDKVEIGLYHRLGAAKTWYRDITVHTSAGQFVVALFASTPGNLDIKLIKADSTEGGDEC